MSEFVSLDNGDIVRRSVRKHRDDAHNQHVSNRTSGGMLNFWRDRSAIHKKRQRCKNRQLVLSDVSSHSSLRPFTGGCPIPVSATSAFVSVGVRSREDEDSVIKADRRCAVCLEDFVIIDGEELSRSTLVKLPCHSSHVFHRNCISKWFANRFQFVECQEQKADSGTCPICRTSIKFKQVPELYAALSELNSKQWPKQGGKLPSLTVRTREL
jgi:hypothetical protein